MNHNTRRVAVIGLTCGLGGLNAMDAGAADPQDRSQPTPYRVEVLSVCPVLPKPGNAIVLYDGDTNRLAGWSHVGGADPARLRRPPASYAVNAHNSRPDRDCRGEPSFQAVLVKKYADWDRQHLNGIESTFASENLRWGDIDRVELVLRLQREDTLIPSPETLRKAYGEWVDASALPAWDAGKANFSLTFFEQGWDEQNEPSFTAQLFIEIDPASQGDRWLRLSLPIAAFTTFTEQNWMPTPRAMADFAEDPVLGLRLNPETRSGKVLRHWRNPLPPEASEHYKEMALSLHSLVVYRKP